MKTGKEIFKFLKDEPIEKIEYIYFDVSGAGNIKIIKEPHSLCGESCGFSFGVSWGRYGYSGGVLGRDEAKRMAEFMLAKIAECDESEEDERIRKYKEIANEGRKIIQ